MFQSSTEETQNSEPKHNQKPRQSGLIAFIAVCEMMPIPGKSLPCCKFTVEPTLHSHKTKPCFVTFSCAYFHAISTWDGDMFRITWLCCVSAQSSIYAVLWSSYNSKHAESSSQAGYAVPPIPGSWDRSESLSSVPSQGERFETNLCILELYLATLSSRTP